jgi:two-component system LytT family response regulator
LEDFNPLLHGRNYYRIIKHKLSNSYHQYAVEGFELNVTDYLLKPFAFDRFLQAVNKVRSPLEQAKEYLFLNVQHKKVKIWFSEILYNRKPV